MKYQFPNGFFWGAATASHQVEGNTHNNWTAWEKANASRLAEEARTKYAPWQQEKFPEMFDPNNYISGVACDHWNRYEEDFDILQSLNLKAYRFTIEWSRIEPKEGHFDESAIAHYREMILALRKRGIEPFVTLWHWTDPVWLEKNWLNKKAPQHFTRYVEKIVTEFKDIVTFWIVINEPNVSMTFGYLHGSQPPGFTGIRNFLTAYFHLLKAFKQSASIIRAIDPKAEIGVANSFVKVDTHLLPGINTLVNGLVRFFERYFFRNSVSACTFIGCNYYMRSLITWKKPHPAVSNRNDLGWEIYPEGLFSVLTELKKYSLPIYITENGLADADDRLRASFIQKHLEQIHRALEAGADVRGYFHWSLLDNFEFPEVRGFWPRFGLVEIDYATQKRTIRPSASLYAHIAEQNGLD